MKTLVLFTLSINAIIASSQLELCAGANIHYEDFAAIWHPKETISRLGKDLNVFLSPTIEASWTNKNTRVYFETAYLASTVKLSSRGKSSSGFTLQQITTSSYYKSYLQHFSYTVNRFGLEYIFLKHKPIQIVVGPFLGFEILLHKKATNHFRSDSHTSLAVINGVPISSTTTTSTSNTSFSMAELNKSQFFAGLRLGTRINLGQSFIRVSANLGYSALSSRFYAVQFDHPTYLKSNSWIDFGVSYGYQFKSKSR